VENGYEDTSFISGMTDDELKDIGVQSTPIRQKLLVEIKELPDYEVACTVPVSFFLSLSSFI
jgi:chitin synthase